MSYDDCVELGVHLYSCDDNGYCNNCGCQDADEDDEETMSQGIEEFVNREGEVVIKLNDGWTLRSGSHTEPFASGEWVRLCDPTGKEKIYWHNDEWQDDPILVMGAIINAAAGYRADMEAQEEDPSWLAHIHTQPVANWGSYTSADPSASGVISHHTVSHSVGSTSVHAPPPLNIAGVAITDHGVNPGPQAYFEGQHVGAVVGGTWNIHGEEADGEEFVGTLEETEWSFDLGVPDVATEMTQGEDDGLASTADAPAGTE